jgi:gamma-glutamyl-gamma-aminobutyrate hydrolase PuuD
MLCALAGGFLVQHVNNHGGWHKVFTPEGSITTNSIHHQMQYPFNVKHEMLGWTEVRSDEHIVAPEAGSVMLEVEPEYVYYPDVKGFAIQWHPEMMPTGSDATQYIFKTMMERL